MVGIQPIALKGLAGKLADPRRARARKLREESMSTAPVGHWTQGLGRLAQALLAAKMGKDIGREQQATQDIYSSGKTQEQIISDLMKSSTFSGQNVAGQMYSQEQERKKLETERLRQAVIDKRTAEKHDLDMKGNIAKTTPRIQNYEYMQNLPEEERPDFMPDEKESLPANAREWEYFNNLTPKQKNQYLTMKRASKVMNLGGKQIVLNPTGGGVAESYLATLKPSEKSSYIKKVTKAKADAIADAKKKDQFPNVRKLFEAQNEKQDNVIRTIDSAIDLTNAWSTGVTGQVLQNVWGSDSANLDAMLHTIKAYVGFGTLQEMRDHSKTGGALGQVSEIELQLLHDSIVSLEQSQDTEQLKKNFRLLKEYIGRIRNRQKEDFLIEAEKYGDTPAPQGIIEQLRQQALPPAPLPPTPPPLLPQGQENQDPLGIR